MELEQLRTFAAIARLGSLSAASATVNLSQPAVSRQVQALERRLGAKLLERGARGVRLTEAGEAVARGAGDVLARLEELDAELALLRGGEGGTLRVGATVTVCLYLLPPLLRRFRESYPRQEIVIVNERSRQIPELVRDRRIDIGIASSSGGCSGKGRASDRTPEHLPTVRARHFGKPALADGTGAGASRNRTARGGRGGQPGGRKAARAGWLRPRHRPGDLCDGRGPGCRASSRAAAGRRPAAAGRPLAARRSPHLSCCAQLPGIGSRTLSWEGGANPK